MLNFVAVRSLNHVFPPSQIAEIIRDKSRKQKSKQTELVSHPLERKKPPLLRKKTLYLNLSQPRNGSKTNFLAPKSPKINFSNNGTSLLESFDRFKKNHEQKVTQNMSPAHHSVVNSPDYSTKNQDKFDKSRKTSVSISLQEFDTSRKPKRLGFNVTDLSEQSIRKFSLKSKNLQTPALSTTKKPDPPRQSPDTRKMKKIYCEGIYNNKTNNFDNKKAYLIQDLYHVKDYHGNYRYRDKEKIKAEIDRLQKCIDKNNKK